MKRLMMTVAALALVLAVLFSTMLIASAKAFEPRTYAEDEAGVVTVEDGGREYQLVWKYATFDGHLWKRRWNVTLGEWYDPDWILVY